MAIEELVACAAEVVRGDESFEFHLPSLLGVAGWQDTNYRRLGREGC